MDITADLKRHAKATKQGQVKRITLSRLRLDGDTQPRTSIDTGLVDEYSEGYLSGVNFPPIDVFFDGVDYWIADGFHRWHAAQKANLNAIECCIHKGTVEDAKWFSYAANQTHGSRRSSSDKAKAVKAALLHPNGAKMSDTQIAEYLGVDQKTVWKYRQVMEASKEIPKMPTRTVKRGNQEYEQDTTNIGTAGKRDIGDGPKSPGDYRSSADKKSREAPLPATNLIGDFKTEVTGMAQYIVGKGAASWELLANILESMSKEWRKRP